MAQRYVFNIREHHPYCAVCGCPFRTKYTLNRHIQRYADKDQDHQELYEAMCKEEAGDGQYTLAEQLELAGKTARAVLYHQGKIDNDTVIGIVAAN